MTDTTNNSNYTELAKEFARATDNVKEVAEEIKGKMANNEKLSQSAIDKADEALVTMNEIKLRLDDLEQKDARRPSGELVHQSVGQKFAESEQFKQLQADPRGVKNAKIELKANITSATTDADGSAGALVNPHRVNGVITPSNRRLTIRDLLMDGTTESNAITYIRETGFTNNAKAQAGEGEKKAQSDIKYDDVTVNVATIAHFFKASRQILDDAPQLASQIDGRLLYGLKLNEELQILNGDGTSGNLKGIIPQATAFADKASLAKYTIIDQLRLAQLQAVLAEYPASGHILNPIDWAKIELAKDDNGNYIIGKPQDGTNPTLWRLPVVETQSMGVGKFLTGAFNLGAQIFDRQQSSVMTGFENDDFTRNLITILAEERLALAVYRPEAFIYGTLAEKTA
ncbi:phage major capsid protein [Moraxella nonliquefaciens]|uniref:phage major capsid protein n=1 Tax=Moraxella nonliquefaciens TaxID=478 RepID=UPI001EF42D5A|nr:phage major capsid protein [Moraxella nonliquefaciens]MCG7412276.1 phage major capsid protein [Moraxella nonliquefaciens]MDI4498768.1 phage major capsid protein [Moraxella nonliquefaciens]MDI4500541.1 phage major capsid protein [Moraxella nonliquefaciens]